MVAFMVATLLTYVVVSALTMIMLPVGVVVGLIGFAMFVGGLFVRLDRA